KGRHRPLTSIAHARGRTAMRLLIVLALAVVTVLGGTPAGAQAPGSQLTVAQLYNPEDMSPWNYTAVATVDIWAHFMEPLTVFDGKGELVGIVAESWQMVSPTEWLVKIRHGMRFHDPKYGELTAEDVKFTLDRAVQPAGGIRRTLPQVIQDGSGGGGDKHPIRWKLGGTGTGSLPNYMSLVHVTSKAYVEGEGKETFKRRPMGTGPYRFVEWVTNQRVVGEAFPGYWGPKPGFGRVVWRILPDALTAKNALLAGEVDLYQFVPPEAIPEVPRNPKTRGVETLS